MNTKNIKLNKAGTGKNDEFYTQREDIENELCNYEEHFEGKVVYCNCDDPYVSQFFYYFSHRFEALKLKKLITTCYQSRTFDMFSQHNEKQAIRLEYTGDKDGNKVPDPQEIGITPLNGDGDFRSHECIEILKEADIVVTNPPFSLFRVYVDQLIKYDKQFLIVGDQNAITYKNVFPLIRDHRIWLGTTTLKWFEIPSHYPLTTKHYKIEDGRRFIKANAKVWWTNLNHKKRNQKIKLYKEYTPEAYPKYDNYEAINVKPVKNIPKNWGGGHGCSNKFSS